VTARILAIDTTAEFGSVALGGEQVLIHAPEGFGGVIFGQIERLLERASMRLEDVEAFAAAAGPGSFTGVRIGLACVKGLAEATGRKAFAISNLAALANFGSSDVSVPVIDARRGEIYGAVYDSGGVLLMPEVVCPFATFLERLPDPPWEFISQDFAPFEPMIRGSRFAQCPLVAAPRAIAGMVAKMTAARLSAGETGEPAGLDANYVRRSDAELLFKPW
jgi:tRNA threonylcarbamoyladenosine biosynthesis protein TsaB